LFRDTFERCIKHNTSLLSAALAFYALLSLAPALYLVVAAAGVVIGRSAARSEVISWSAQMLGSGGARFIGEVLDRGGSGGSFATIAGVLSLAYGATVAFGALQDALNLIWEVPPPERGYIKQFFIKRLISFLAVMIVGVLLLVSLLTDAITSAAGKLMPQALPATEFLLHTANFVAGLAGRMDRGRDHRASVLDWKGSDRAVLGTQHHQHPVWRSRIRGDLPVVGVLLGADFSVRSRV
jgi:membrane protein